MLHVPTSNQPVLRPVIAELLRTCVHPPTLLLRVERVVRNGPGQNSAGPNNGRAGYHIKLYLTDGHLLIQALLDRTLTTLPEVQDIRSEDLIQIRTFEVKRSTRLTQDGYVVYLGIRDCHIIQKGATLTDGYGTGTSLNNDQRGTKRSAESAELDDPFRDKDGNAGAMPRGGLDGENSPKRQHTRENSNTSLHNPQQALLDRGEHPHSPTDTNQPIEPGSPRERSPLNLNGQIRKSPDDVTTFDSIDQANVFSNRKRSLDLSSGSDSEDDAFESSAFDLKSAEQRRQALHALEQNTLTSQTRSQPSAPPAIAPVAQNVDQADKPRRVQFKLPSDRNDTPTFDEQVEILDARSRSHERVKRQNSSQPIEPPFHNLHSLLSPPSDQPLPLKSYTLTTLAMITYVGSALISRPNSPFPPKRHLKIEDPSLYTSRPNSRPSDGSNSSSLVYNQYRHQTSKTQLNMAGVTVAVYDSAATFKPQVGTLALFRGVVMQKLSNGDVILNVYAGSSRLRRGISPAPLSRESSDVADEEHVGGVGGKEDSLSSVGSGEFGFGKKTVDRDWFIDDLDTLRAMGHDVDSMLRWWDERNRSKRV